MNLQMTSSTYVTFRGIYFCLFCSSDRLCNATKRQRNFLPRVALPISVKWRRLVMITPVGQTVFNGIYLFCVRERIRQCLADWRPISRTSLLTSRRHLCERLVDGTGNPPRRVPSAEAAFYEARSNMSEDLTWPECRNWASGTSGSPAPCLSGWPG